MARYLYITVCSLLIAAGWTVPAQPQSQQQRNDLVKQRLMADMRELKNQLSQLNKTVNQLQETVSTLKRQNQRNRNRIRKLKRQVNNREGGSSSNLRSSRTQSERDSARNYRRRSSRDQSAQTRTQEKDENWVDTPNHPYKIRKEPLDHRVIFVTTDDTTLTKLAHQYYRDASFWKIIYEINKDKLPSPDVIPPGINLILPPVENLR